MPMRIDTHLNSVQTLKKTSSVDAESEGSAESTFLVDKAPSRRRTKSKSTAGITHRRSSLLKSDDNDEGRHSAARPPPTERRARRRTSMGSNVSSFKEKSVVDDRRRTRRVQRHASMSGDQDLLAGMQAAAKGEIRRGKKKPQRRKVAKSVSFAEEPTDYLENTLYPEEDVPELWYDRYDLEAFSHDLETIVDDITTKLKKRTDGWRKGLMRAYDMSCSADSDDCFEDRKSATYKLVTYRLKDVYMETVQLVGLEHLLADNIRSDGNRRRARVLDLMDKQRSERERRQYLKTHLPEDDTKDNQKLFDESIDASRASRFFAHGVAVARIQASSRPLPDHD